MDLNFILRSPMFYRLHNRYIGAKENVMSVYNQTVILFQLMLTGIKYGIKMTKKGICPEKVNYREFNFDTIELQDLPIPKNKKEMSDLVYIICLRIMDENVENRLRASRILLKILRRWDPVLIKDSLKHLDCFSGDRFVVEKNPRIASVLALINIRVESISECFKVPFWKEHREVIDDVFTKMSKKEVDKYGRYRDDYRYTVTKETDVPVQSETKIDIHAIGQECKIQTKDNETAKIETKIDMFAIENDFSSDYYDDHSMYSYSRSDLASCHTNVSVINQYGNRDRELDLTSLSDLSDFTECGSDYYEYACNESNSQFDIDSIRSSVGLSGSTSQFDLDSIRSSVGMSDQHSLFDIESINSNVELPEFSVSSKFDLNSIDSKFCLSECESNDTGISSSDSYISNSGSDSQYYAGAVNNDNKTSEKYEYGNLVQSTSYYQSEIPDFIPYFKNRLDRIKDELRQISFPDTRISKPIHNRRNNMRSQSDTAIEMNYRNTSYKEAISLKMKQSQILEVKDSLMVLLEKEHEKMHNTLKFYNKQLSSSNHVIQEMAGLLAGDNIMPTNLRKMD